MLIVQTIDAVDYVDLCNLATLNQAMHGGLLDLLKVKLMRVGAGPTLDYDDASAFFADFQPMLDASRARPDRGYPLPEIPCMPPVGWLA